VVLAAAGLVLLICAAMLLSRARPGAVRAVFFIHRDGRLVRHFASHEMVVDPVIFSGMLTALEAFVRDSVAEGTGPLQELRFGGRAFVLERGNDLLAVAVCDGVPSVRLRSRLRTCIGSIEGADPSRLRAWDGSQVAVPESVEASVSGLIDLGSLPRSAASA